MEDPQILDYKICESIDCKHVFKKDYSGLCPKCKGERFRKFRESDLLKAVNPDLQVSSTWIKANYDLGITCATLFFSDRFKEFQLKLPHFNGLLNQQETEQLATKIQEYIESKEPRLKGVTVIQINYDVAARAWTAAAIHPLFPRRLEYGEMPVRIVMDADPSQLFLEHNVMHLHELFDQPIVIEEVK